jgi:predicted nucleic acid-binding Zn ribbon protein
VPPKSASLLAGCTLARPHADGCAWCGQPLPARRRTWCSERCSDAFWDNHWWSRARVAAKRRDKYRCARCGHVPPKRPSRTRFPVETDYRAAMRVWRAGRAANRVEVNHRLPALGAHGTLSCIHHLDNLETLCVECHKSFTAAGRRASTPGSLVNATKRMPVRKVVR